VHDSFSPPLVQEQGIRDWRGRDTYSVLGAITILLSPQRMAVCIHSLGNSAMVVWWPLTLWGTICRLPSSLPSRSFHTVPHAGAHHSSWPPCWVGAAKLSSLVKSLMPEKLTSHVGSFSLCLCWSAPDNLLFSEFSRRGAGNSFCFQMFQISGDILIALPGVPSALLSMHHPFEVCLILPRATFP
jgi:hypothetical protein